MRGNIRRYLAVTMGDPAGIGPEVIMKAVSQNRHWNSNPILVGRYDVLSRTRDRFAQGLVLDRAADRTELDRLLDDTARDTICVYDTSSGDYLPEPGKGDERTGASSLRCIDDAIDLWKGEYVAGMVTGPVSKALIEKSGTPFTGHTEYIAERTGGFPYMMMYSPDYTVILVTMHLPIQSVHVRVTAERIEHTAKAALHALKRINGRDARLAVAGLDPHCGDNGAIGPFDRDVTVPLVRRMKKSGLNIEGPYSADTLFIPDRWKQYDGIIAMYHDQGLIPFKMCAFETGVNVTLGLPIVRTSVDHGTAFDIAGRGIASHASFVHAYELAMLLSGE
ncbi:MAG: 4-hydroxythreonine-4-phosphate dehydrogenase PdxA [Spirochaetota bacterium]